MPELQATMQAVSRPHRAVPWWERADELAAQRSAAPTWQATYRLGDAYLELATDCDALIGELGDHYGECQVPPSEVPADPMRIRCTVRALEGQRIALVRCESQVSGDRFDDALALLKHPVANPLYVEADESATGGWRLIVHAASREPVVAVRGDALLIDIAIAGARALGQLLVDPVLALQRGLLFAHAASVGIDGGGILLIGPSGSGKTTTAITLASRGHRYFGDDVAALRTETTELLPFWRIAHVRPGPHARSLAGHMAHGQWDAPYSDGLPRLRLRVADVFPSAASTPLPLRGALFLRGFAAQPRVEPFVPEGRHFAAGSRFALNNTLWVAWGRTPQLRMLQFMLFMRLLQRVPCAWLDAADPEDTADLIERSQEDSWH